MTNYDELTTLFNQAPRYDFRYQEEDIDENGIYVMFEKSEKHLNIDRIVRIGSHTGINRLRKRINEHYIGADHRDSIFRKHIGRSLLSIDKHIEYIKIWDLRIKRKKDRLENYHKIDWTLERTYEKKITDYIRTNFTFIIIPNLTETKGRIRLEKGLIATFAQNNKKIISENWLGKHHPDARINNSG